jgi:rhamnosyltransferase
MLNMDAVVVLYHPDDSIIENLKSYQQVNTIYAVDNSENYDDDLIEKLKQFENLIYINNNGNQGIAHALNVGAKKAIENGVDWLLTMDQDSKFSLDGLSHLKQCLMNKIENNIQVGLVAPSHKENQNDDVQKELVVMTSGNIVNLKAYSEVFGFEEKLFIDAVDYDFCLKLNIAGYKVLQCNRSLLIHQLGESKSFKILGKTIKSFTHSPIRRYYMSRNALYYWQKYFWQFPTFILKKIIGFQRNWIEIFLFSNNKLEDIKMMTVGFYHYFKNQYGKFRE